MRSEDTEPTPLGLCSRDHVLYLLYTTSFQPQALLGQPGRRCAFKSDILSIFRKDMSGGLLNIPDRGEDV